MTTAFPAALDAYGDPTGGAVQGSTTPTHSGHHTNHNDAIEALEAKLGTGSSIAAANTVLRGTGSGVTSYGQVAAAMLATGAISQVALAAPTTVSPSTSGAEVLMDQMTVTISCVGSGLLLIFYEAILQNVTVGAVNVLDLFVGGANVTRREVGCKVSTAADHVGGFYVLNSTPGSLTVEVKWFATGGTLTSPVLERALMALELRL
jgi:hypothetical protein